MFINGISQGVKKATSATDGHTVTWTVNYAAGKIKAVGKKYGIAWCADSLTTVAGTQKISLSPDRPIMKADGLDRVYVKVTVTDSTGSYVPTANQAITFSVTGPATIIAKHNSNAWGDFRVGTAYYGTCLVSLQSTGGVGNVTLTASATGLSSGSLTIPASAFSAQVPYVFGLSKVAAIMKINGSGLSVGSIKYRYSASVAEGNIINQTPVYWSSVASGAPVNLTVSSSIPLPDQQTVTIADLQSASISASSIKITAGIHSIDFSVPTLGNVTNLSLDLYTVQGKFVQTLFSTATKGGCFSVPYNAKNFSHARATMIYCAVLHYGGMKKVLPISLIKH
jgi:hypothetical protein